MRQSNKKILILIIAVAVVVCTIMILLKPDTTTTPPQEALTNEEATKNDENINGLDEPIFMYFVTNADLENSDTKATLDRLQKEYADTVIFDIKNVDEEPELKDNFPVEGNMPMLIMQKKGGDISTFLFMCNDYNKLKEAIDATL